jgi:hypothetical protein
LARNLQSEKVLTVSRRSKIHNGTQQAGVLAGEKEWNMSLVSKLMIGEWITTLAMIGVCALNESGRLLEIGRRIVLWLETPASAVGRTSKESLQLGARDAA